MSNLIKKEALPVVFYEVEQINPALKANQKKALLATKGQTVRATSEDDLKKILISTVIAANSRLGHKAKEDEDIKAITNDLTNILLDSYNSLTIKELGLAVSLGTLGEFNTKDQVKFISVSSIVDWIKCYLEFKTKAQASNKTYLEAVEKAKEAEEFITKAKAFEESKPEAIKAVYLEALEAGELSTSRPYIYAIYFDYLYNQEVIKFTPERFSKIKEKATNIVRLRDLEKKTRFNKLSQAITNSSIKTEAKKLAFAEYINDLVEMDEPLPPLN